MQLKASLCHSNETLAPTAHSDFAIVGVLAASSTYSLKELTTTCAKQVFGMNSTIFS